MKKLNCNKCKKGKMKLKSQRLFDPSTWRKGRKPKWTKVRKSSIFRAVYKCVCGNRRDFVGKSKSEVFAKVR